MPLSLHQLYTLPPDLEPVWADRFGGWLRSRSAPLILLGALFAVLAIALGPRLWPSPVYEFQVTREQAVEAAGQFLRQVGHQPAPDARVYTRLQHKYPWTRLEKLPAEHWGDVVRSHAGFRWEVRFADPGDRTFYLVGIDMRTGQVVHAAWTPPEGHYPVDELMPHEAEAIAADLLAAQGLSTEGMIIQDAWNESGPAAWHRYIWSRPHPEVPDATVQYEVEITGKRVSEFTSGLVTSKSEPGPLEGLLYLLGAALALNSGLVWLIFWVVYLARGFVTRRSAYGIFLGAMLLYLPAGWVSLSEKLVDYTGGEARPLFLLIWGGLYALGGLAISLGVASGWGIARVVSRGRWPDLPWPQAVLGGLAVAGISFGLEMGLTLALKPWLGPATSSGSVAHDYRQLLTFTAMPLGAALVELIFRGWLQSLLTRITRSGVLGLAGAAAALTLVSWLFQPAGWAEVLILFVAQGLLFGVALWAGGLSLAIAGQAGLWLISEAMHGLHSGLPSAAAGGWLAVGVLLLGLAFAWVRRGSAAAAPGESVAVAALTHRPGIGQNQPSPWLQKGLWRFFFSPGTAISALLSVLLWSLLWDWVAGIFLVLLLYVHEAGHVAAAIWRRLPVRRAPFFLPGFGAFVQVGPSAGATHWDHVWLSLGGPLLGTAAALAAKWAGMAWSVPSLAFAGDIGMLINLFNMAPFRPLDGGNIIAFTGWIGLIPSILLGVVLLFAVHDLITVAIVGFGIFYAVRGLRGKGLPGWGARLGILGTYLAVLLGLLLAFGLGERVPSVPSSWPVWMPSLFTLVQAGFALAVAGWLLLPYTQRPGLGAAVRFGGLALLGWPRLLLAQPVLIPVSWLIGLQAVGLRTERALVALLRFAPGSWPVEAGVAAAWQYLCLTGSGRSEEAESWLRRSTALLGAMGGEAVGGLVSQLTVEGLHAEVLRVFAWWQDGVVTLPADAPAHLYNNLAWVHYRLGSAEAALPFARRCVEMEPENPAYLDTLGGVLLAHGDPQGAEVVLRKGVAIQPILQTRIHLAQALAAQERYREAAEEAKAILQKHQGPWISDPPARTEFEQWQRAWEQSAQGEPGGRVIQ